MNDIAVKLKGVIHKVNVVLGGLGKDVDYRTKSVIDVYHGVKISNIVSAIEESTGKKVGYIPLSEENVRRCKSEGLPYIDIYKSTKLLDIETGKHLGGADSIEDKIFSPYEVFIFDNINTVEHNALREIVNEIYKLKKLAAIIFIIDTFDYIIDKYVPTSKELRADICMSSPIDRNPDYAAEVTYLAVRYRRGSELILEEKNIRSYKFKAVDPERYFDDLDITELLEYDKILVSRQKLYAMNNFFREQLGIDSYLPVIGEKVIAYNNFKTLDGDKSIIIRKGATMTVSALYADCLIEVEYDGNRHKICYDPNMFSNMINESTYGTLSNSFAHIYYAYAIDSRLFLNTSFENVYLYIDKLVSASYVYTAMKCCRKKIDIAISREIVDMELL